MEYKSLGEVTVIPAQGFYLMQVGTDFYQVDVLRHMDHKISIKGLPATRDQLKDLLMTLVTDFPGSRLTVQGYEPPPFLPMPDLQASEAEEQVDE